MIHLGSAFRAPPHGRKVNYNIVTTTAGPSRQSPRLQHTKLYRRQDSSKDTPTKIAQQEALSLSKFCNYLESLQNTRDKRESALKMDSELAIMEDRWKLSIGNDRRYTGWYLKDDEDVGRTYKGLAFKPDVTCYTIVANAYANAGMGEEGAKLVENLVERFTSNSRTQQNSKELLSAVVKAWAVAENWTKANEWLDRMTKNGSLQAPDMVTYTMYLGALSQSKSTNEIDLQRETLAVLDRMKKLTVIQNWAARRWRAKLSQRLSSRTADDVSVHSTAMARAVLPSAILRGAFIATTLACVVDTIVIRRGQLSYNSLFVKGMSTKLPPAAALSVAAFAVALAGILFVSRTSSGPAPRGHDQTDGTEGVRESVAGSSDTPSIRGRRMTRTDEESIQTDGLLVKPIGVVHSIYRLCVGTPRQGLLAPNAHGRIELKGLSADAVDGLECFSHIWIVFIFHLNTQAKNSSRIPSKIAPPALGGRKIGVFATRSPHRNNPIGMTLCKLDSITKPNKSSNKTFLNVSGLDLVDGTPVVDIKPYVPHYDSVPADQLTLPSWVSGGLATRRPVNIEAQALHALEDILTENPKALQFYGGDGQSLDAIVDQVANCIAEVLSVDVRSAWQTKKAREGRSQAERAERVQGSYTEATDNVDGSGGTQLCTQQLDNLLIHYTVSQPESQSRDASEGSGAEDIVSVHSIQLQDQSAVNLQIETRTSAVTDEVEAQSVASQSVCELDVAQSNTNEIISNIEEERKAAPPLVLSPQLLKKAPEKSRVQVVASIEEDIPTDGEYHALKNYWSMAASKNTPTGLIPDKERRQSSKRSFVFSDKPVGLQQNDEPPTIVESAETNLSTPDQPPTGST